MKTYSAKPQDIDAKWFVIDASVAPLGRLATRVATVIRGKHKPIFTPHMDTGDFVIVINAENLVFTGQKMEQKIYDRYSGYQSGRRERTAAEQLEIDPTVMVSHAVKGMLPKGRLGRSLLKKLKVYSGAEHPHKAQQPEPLSLT